MPSARPLASRPLDVLYILWFTIHLLITIFIDCVPLYPSALQFPFLLQIRNDYIRDFKDPLAINPPAWFTGYLIVEGVYQAPLCAWAVRALINDRATVPIHLIVYCVQTAVTTCTCLIEIFSSNTVTWDEKVALAWLYGGFAVVPALMGADMFVRIRRRLLDDGQGRGIAVSGKGGKEL